MYAYMKINHTSHASTSAGTHLLHKHWNCYRLYQVCSVRDWNIFYKTKGFSIILSCSHLALIFTVFLLGLLHACIT